ncbi:DNRLRE domain-containing protein [Fictibacillus aquaticus]|uniref:Wall-associated protein n=1 Tax=Fictibacillus aquaticus TaxID=2021314 RepID=A0A235F8I8_9BACL|nr:DNRLRE domain-containing protein [Fictibacillus aquaticus]OYD57620.1 hypothetical protein CGZ90_13215 [Fictibacillus aquaticus]
MGWKAITHVLVAFTLVFSSIPFYSIDVEAASEKKKVSYQNVIKEEKLNVPEVAKKQKKEKREARKEKEKVIDNGDGTFTKQIYSVPVHKKNSKKEYEDLSSSLVEEGQVIKPKKTFIGSEFKKELHNNNYVSFKDGEDFLSYKLLDASSGESTVRPLKSKALFHDNFLTYENIFAGVDLRHIVSDTAVKEDIVLNQKTDLNTFRFEINTNLNAVLQEGGSISFLDDKDEERYILPKPFMADSNINKESGESQRSDNVHFEIEKQSKSKYILTLTADKNWLLDSERVYPIYIDPTTKTAGTTQDTFVSDAYPTTNYGAFWDSSAGFYSLKVGKYDASSGLNYAYLKQDVTPFQYSVIDSATLKLYTGHSYYPSTVTGVWADEAGGSSSWTETGMTWNNKPPTKTANIASDTVYKGQWAELPVTNTVKNWVEGKSTNYGFKIHTSTFGTSYWKKFYSSENSTNKPFLSVTYHYPTTTTPVSTAFTYGNSSNTGYVDLKWNAVSGATSYKVLIFNGKVYEEFPVGNVTSWSTKNQKIWPTPEQISANGFTGLNHSKTGMELPIDPSYVYKASGGGTYDSRKNYAMRVVAVFDGGESAASEAAVPVIPVMSQPATPTGKAFSNGNGTGYVDVHWKAVAGATGYKVWFFNGKGYQSFDAGNSLFWTSKGKKIYPTAVNRYWYHTDKLGTELSADPSVLYRYAQNTTYANNKNYWILVSAYNSQGETVPSGSYKPVLPTLNLPSTPTGTAYSNYDGTGYVDVNWTPVLGAAGYKVWIFNGKGTYDFGKTPYQSFEVGNTTSWSSKGKKIWPTKEEIADVNNPEGYLLHTDGLGEELPADPSPVYRKAGSTTYANHKNYWIAVSAYDSLGETAMSATFRPTIPTPPEEALKEELLGFEDYFTYGSHEMGTGSLSVNVTTGNAVMEVPDQEMYTRGALGFTFTRFYNSRSNRSSALGKGWSFTGGELLKKIEASGSEPAKIVYYDEDGTLHTFTYDSGTNSYTSPKGKYLNLTSETINGNTAYRIKDKDQFSKVFEVSPNNGEYRLYSYEDFYKNTIRFIYNTSNELIEIKEVDSAGNKVKNSLSLTYQNGLLDNINYISKNYKFDYNNGKLIRSTVTADGSSESIVNEFGYTADGLLETFKDGEGNVNTVTYASNQIMVEEPATENTPSESNTYTFDFANNNYASSNQEGTVTTYKRDVINNTFAVNETLTNNNNASTKFIFDNHYNVTSIVEKKGDAPLKTQSNTFDSNGNLVKSLLENGTETPKVSEFKYDTLNRVIEKIDPEGEKTSITYSTDQRTITSSVGIDKTIHEFDAYGRQIKVLYPNNTFETTQFIDSENKIIQTDKDNNSITKTYTDYGSEKTVTDKEGRTQSYSYDPLFTDRVFSITDGLQNKTSYDYDKNGNIAAITNAKGIKKSYLYNDNDLLTDIVMPINADNTMRFNYSYDLAGNLQETIKNSGISIKNELINEDQVSSIKVSKESETLMETSITYTDGGNAQSIVHNDISNNVQSQKSFEYYDSDLLKQLNQDKFQVNYQYDNVERPVEKSLKYTSENEAWNVIQGIMYNNEGRENTLSTLINGQNALTYDYSYDLPNNKVEISFNSGLINKEMSFKNSNVVEFIKYTASDAITPYAQFEYRYDGSGNILKEISGQGETTFSYDANNQLTQETLTNGSIIAYEYDSVGNRKKTTRNGEESIFTYNDGNQIVTKNGIQYSYDLDGNLIQDERFGYEYNGLGQLIKVNDLQNNEVARYEYDEEGMRTKKISGNETREYLYEAGSLFLEIVKDSSGIKQYKYYQWDTSRIPLGMVISEKDENLEWKEKKYHFITNQRGDVIQILDNSRNQVGSYSYDSYGNVLSEDGVLASDNTIRYAGYYYDVETKLYYLQARYYNPDNGCFLSYDPFPGDADDPISQNGYTYANNNPVVYVDPDGDFPWWILAKFAYGGAMNSWDIVWNFYKKNGLKWSKWRNNFPLSKFGKAFVVGGVTEVLGISWTKALKYTGVSNRVVHAINFIKTESQKYLYNTLSRGEKPNFWDLITHIRNARLGNFGTFLDVLSKI